MLIVVYKKFIVIIECADEDIVIMGYFPVVTNMYDVVNIGYIENAVYLLFIHSCLANVL